jgi:hypothetical protein
MVDISMCQDTECPMRAKCYRYRAAPSDHWQSYMIMPRKGDQCNYYEPFKMPKPKYFRPLKEVDEINTNPKPIKD